ncbi:MAG: hypothetical protein AB7O96_08195 [Pseudobdellovibrionaceae bacterium]
MLFLSIILSQAVAATSLGPTSFPVFLKEGFSSILEFEEAPTQVVLGDQNLFQIEKLNKSIVIKPLTPYATTNMFVYFKTKEAKLFILTASEESEPTYYKKFSTVLPKIEAPKPSAPKKYVRGTRLKSSSFDKKKDFFTVDFEISADSTGKVTPNWDLIRLKHKDRIINPSKLWSERREVQQDSSVKGRLIFTKPNIPLDMKDVSVIIPIKGSTKSMTLNLQKGR